MNDTIEIPVELGRHTVQIRSGRNASRNQIFEAAESENRRLPAHRKELPADLSRVLPCPNLGAATPP
jgi:hypothetical protein